MPRRSRSGRPIAVLTALVLGAFGLAWVPAVVTIASADAAAARTARATPLTSSPLASRPDGEAASLDGSGAIHVAGTPAVPPTPDASRRAAVHTPVATPGSAPARAASNATPVTATPAPATPVPAATPRPASTRAPSATARSSAVAAATASATRRPVARRSSEATRGATPTPAASTAPTATPTATPRAPAAPAAQYVGRNHFWFPSLGIDYGTSLFPCDRTAPPDLALYRWGCAGHNNVYLLAHAYAKFKALNAAYENGRLHVGQLAIWADASGRIHYFKLSFWKLGRPTTEQHWAWDPQPRSSMTLQTCVGANSEYRVFVRFLETPAP